MNALDQAFIKAFHRHERELLVGVEGESNASANSEESWEGETPSRPTDVEDAQQLTASDSTAQLSDDQRTVWAADLTSIASELDVAPETACESQIEEDRREAEVPETSEPTRDSQQSAVLELAEESEDATPEIALELVPEAPPTAEPEAANAEPMDSLEDEPGEMAFGKEAWTPGTLIDGFDWSGETTQLGQVAVDPLDALADELLVGMTMERRVVAVAGTKSRCGCTTVAMCAARRLAARGITTALCDADRANHALASRLGCRPTVGWEDALEGRVSLPEALIGAKQESVVVLPLLGRALGNASDWSPMADHLRLLRDRYDFVLLDLGAFSATAMTTQFAGALQVIDGVIVVDDIRDSSRERYSEIHRRICQVGLTPVGVVENFVRDGAPEQCTNPIGS